MEKEIKNILILISVFIVFSSCGFIHFVSTKQNIPKTENEIQSYLSKEKIKYDYSFLFPYYFIDSLSNKNHILNMYKKKTGAKASTIQVRIYNSKGRLLNAYSQCYGSIKKLNIFSKKDFKSYDWLPTNYKLRFNNELDLLQFSDSLKKEILIQSNKKKYTMVIYWNIWSNYYSKIIFKKVKKYFKIYKNREQFLIILLNTDKHK